MSPITIPLWLLITLVATLVGLLITVVSLQLKLGRLIRKFEIEPDLVDSTKKKEVVTTVEVISHTTHLDTQLAPADRHLRQHHTDDIHARVSQEIPSQISTHNINLTDEFKFAVDTLEKSSYCIFITGEAGTGKSTLLRYFIEHTKKKVVVLAPTGVAALNVGGQTIHSFFKFPPRPISPADIGPSLKAELCKSLDAIIIDEISMVRADLLDAIDYFLRLNGPSATEPFGGIQLIFFGDLFQLPPVTTTHTEGQFFGQYYKSPYFFDAHVFDNFNVNVIKLKHVYRQRDPMFVEILNRIRIGKYTSEDILKLNQQYDTQFEPQPGAGYLTLTTTNKLADMKNMAELAKLHAKEFMYEAKVVGTFDEKSYPTDYLLRLKVGTQVMFVKNDLLHRWVNGTIGIVDELAEDSIRVRIPTPPGQPPCIYEVGRVEWEVLDYKLNHNTRSIDSNQIGCFTQYPLKLAWAVTIHKGQGKTFDKVIIDFGSGAFAHGQAYVALSRCTSLERMILRQQLRSRDIIVDNHVFGFLNKLSTVTE